MRAMSKPLYHHAIELRRLRYGVLHAAPEHSDPEFLPAYRWVEREVGFFPLFLAVGSTVEDVRMTGYMNNWLREWARRSPGRASLIAGVPENLVLLSFDHVDGVFTDYLAWHIVLNGAFCRYEFTPYERRQVLKPSLTRSRWLLRAKRHPHLVQLVTPRWTCGRPRACGSAMSGRGGVSRRW